MKVISIVGARPQFVKLAPFSKQLRSKYDELIIHTGQHYSDNMSAQFFESLEIPLPDINIGVGSGRHGQQTAAMLEKLEEVYITEKPDMVVVFGDTNSTLAGAIAAAKLQIPIAHVEAGLRSFNKSMPEEVNRILTDHCSDLLFAPTETAMQHLQNEGLEKKSFLTGDIMLDVLQDNLDRISTQSKTLQTLHLAPKEYLVLTLHRPYNVDDTDGLKQILAAVQKCDKTIVFPVHPRTRKKLNQLDLSLNSNLKIIDPLGYIDFVWLEKNAAKIITDSGGIQKEAYMLQVPCITVRPETEWVETVADGWNILVGADSDKLLDAICHFEPKSQQGWIFGNGKSAAKMIDIIETSFR